MHCWCEYKVVQPPWKNSLAISYKIKHILRCDTRSTSNKRKKKTGKLDFIKMQNFYV